MPSSYSPLKRLARSTRTISSPLGLKISSRGSTILCRKERVVSLNPSIRRSIVESFSQKSYSYLGKLGIAHSAFSHGSCLSSLHRGKIVEFATVVVTSLLIAIVASLCCMRPMLDRPQDQMPTLVS
ncbi:hypothetical protein ACLOJK_019225 [Asimina triloba]